MREHNSSAEARAFWTAQKIEDMKSLFAQGHSAARIAREIGAASRNAVIGKLLRLGVKRGGAPRASGPLSAARPRAASSFAKPASERRVNVQTNASRPLPKPKPVDATPKHLDIFALDDTTCRYPLGSQAPFTFCGCAVRHHDEKPYCPAHAAICFTEPPARARRDGRVQARTNF